MNDAIEGVANIHGNIHEGQHHQSFEKRHHLSQQMSFPKSTWNFCETSMLFQTAGHHMYHRGYVVLQTIKKWSLVQCMHQLYALNSRLR